MSSGVPDCTQADRHACLPSSLRRGERRDEPDREHGRVGATEMYGTMTNSPPYMHGPLVTSSNAAQLPRCRALSVQAEYVCFPSHKSGFTVHL